MNNNDFVINNGVLTKYNGRGGDVVIPDGVTSIGTYAFDNCRGLTSLVISEGVTSIGNYAFSSCFNLTSVAIPKSVSSIGDGAFGGCSSLVSIIIPVGILCIGKGAFKDCTSLSNITIPGSVASIGNEAFKDCTGLTSVVISDGLTSINWKVFMGCSSLTSVVIPGSVTKIGNCAFAGCRSLTSIVIPEGVTEIEQGAFAGCDQLVSISLPYSMTTFGQDPFAGPPEGVIRAPGIPVPVFDMEDKIKVIKGFAELYCEGVEMEDFIFDLNKKYVSSQKKKMLSIAITKHIPLLTFLLNECKITIDEIDKLIEEPDCSVEAKAMLLEHRESKYSKRQKEQKADRDLGVREPTAAELRKIWSTEKLADGTLMITSYKQDETKAEIPSKIGRTPVTAISELAFGRVPGMTSLTIPESVTNIHYFAFTLCNNLTIHTPVGSYAAQYAKDRKINLVEE